MVKRIIVGILLLPVAEVATFVLVGLLIGFGWALLLAMATSVAGFVVLRQAGRGRLARFRTAVSKNDIARIEANTSDFLMVLAGILLFLPGFLTDLAGALLLVGPLRRRCAAAFGGVVTAAQRGGGREVIDLKPDEWQQMPERGQERDPERGGDKPDRR